MSAWDLGAYELVAEDLAPAAETLIEAATVRPGELVVDVGCGAGTAALVAAARGVFTVGVDPAARLIEVAQAEADRRGLSAFFCEGRAETLPFLDRSFDVALSSFGVIFADPRQAIAELTRVATDRIALTAWIPEGPLEDVEALRQLCGEGLPPRPRFDWHDPQTVAQEFGKHGWSVEVEEHELPIAAASASAFVKRELEHHPMWVAARAALESPRAFAALADSATSTLSNANELPSAFQVTARYIVIRCTPMSARA